MALTKERNPPTFTPLHQAACRGNLPEIKRHLRFGVNRKDSQGRTPLCHAVINRRRNAVVYLLKKGADPYETDHNQLNIIHYAKSQNRHTRFSRFLKNKIGLTKEQLQASIKPFIDLFKKKLAAAKSKKKKLIILLGETHGNYRIYQIEKRMLEKLSQLGINNLFVEANEESNFIQNEYMRMINKKSPRMVIHGVDNHPQRETASLRKRNKYINQGITEKQQHGVFITGLHHLYGLAQDKRTKLSCRKFIIVPVNLSAFFEKVDNECVEDVFAFDERKVLQFKLL